MFSEHRGPVQSLRPSSALLFFLFVALSLSAHGQPIAPNAQRQIAALLAEKSARTPAQQKVDSHLVHAAAIVQRRPVHPDFPAPPGELEAVRPDLRNFVEVDISAEVTPALLADIAGLGGTVETAFPQYRSIRAHLPLLSIERVAERPEVRSIRTADYGHGTAGPHARRPRLDLARLRSSLRSAFQIGADTSGDIAHQGNVARATYGLDGTGIRIGVLSDGVNSMAAEQAAGRLPALNVIPGEFGGGDEGTAMLEILSSLAPGATLYFATSLGGQANMAHNMQLLANAGCRIIIDDWTYFAEGVFQDDVIARQVESLAASGILFFSDAQNSGSVLKGNSGTWEGDFLDSGVAPPPLPAVQASGGSLHNFGSPANVSSYDSLTRLSSFADYELKWSDPLGASSNDYDLFILDPGMTTVLASSTNVQNGSQNPEEFIPSNLNLLAGARIVVVKHPSAAPRALHLDTERGTLTIGTSGATFGHNAAAGVVTMAAADVEYAGGGAFTGGPANPVYFFSSDGPRRLFFNGDGSAITPGNLLLSTGGGSQLNKPDLTAADGVPTGVIGYNPFYGTSAAGPHAGAIAALVLQAKPSLTPAQVRSVLASSALDIEASGWDINSGAGIVMAPGSIAAAIQLPGPSDLPSLRITQTHTGDFLQGQRGASYSLSVSNLAGAQATSGAVTVTAAPQFGLALVSLSGPGWNCSANACTRTDALPGGDAYPAITVTVNVAANAPPRLTSQASVSGGGSAPATATVLAVISAPSPPRRPRKEGQTLRPSP